MIQCPNCSRLNRDGAIFCAFCRTALFPDTIGGEYHVLSVIDTGGKARVYKAERHGKYVAVKELSNAFTDSMFDIDEAVNLMLAEALTLARLRHPSIPVIQRLFIEDEHCYLVMDWVEGQDLAAFMVDCTHAPVPEDQVIDWALQLCDVLEYMHSQNPPVVFRDLKPAHIMMDFDGNLTLVGFGLAELFPPGWPSMPLGTPGYAAPEQYNGIAEPRSDIYALGATLYYLLSGQATQQYSPSGFPPLRTVNSLVSRELESIVKKALRSSLDDRWASAAEMRQGILNIFGGLSSQAGRNSGYQVVGSRRFWTWGGSRRMYVARDVETGVEYGIFPLSDFVMGGLAQSLVKLNKADLPHMKIATHRNRTLFVCEKVPGISLRDAAISDDSLLTSVGMQLCHLFSVLGDLQEAFRWLKSENIVIDESGKVRIDVVSHFITSTRDEHALVKNEDILAPLLLNGLGEVGVVTAVGRALWSAVTGGGGYPPCHLEFLFRCWPSLSPSLAALLVLVVNQHSGSLFVETLSELRNHLINPPPPAKASLSHQYVDFGTLELGEIRKRSIRLSTLTPGMFYGEFYHPTNELAVAVYPSVCCGFHPFDVDVEIELNTWLLPSAGQYQGQITLVTPLENVVITTRADVLLAM